MENGIDAADRPAKQIEEVEVTPEMVMAGAREISWFNPELDSGFELAKAVYSTMEIARRRALSD
jgi:hypothetical protein